MTSTRVIYMSVIAAGAGLLLWRGVALRGEVAARDEASAKHEKIASVVEEVQSLRAQIETTGVGARPKEDIMAFAQTVMARAGVPADRLRDITTSGERAVGGSGSSAGAGVGGVGVGAVDGLVQYTLSVAWENLTLPELGLLLREWHARQHTWTASRLELTLQPAASSASAGALSPASPNSRRALYAARMVVDAHYMALPSGTPEGKAR